MGNLFIWFLLIKLFVSYKHYTLYLQENVEDLRSTINVPVGDLGSFFWDHLRVDLAIIGRALSRGEDEVAMLLHQVVNTISQLDVKGDCCNTFDKKVGNSKLCQKCIFIYAARC